MRILTRYERSIDLMSAIVLRRGDYIVEQSDASLSEDSLTTPRGDSAIGGQGMRNISIILDER